jgi:hypothetical protein
MRRGGRTGGGRVEGECGRDGRLREAALVNGRSADRLVYSASPCAAAPRLLCCVLCTKNPASRYSRQHRRRDGGARSAGVCIYRVSTRVRNSAAKDICENRDLAYERTRTQSKRDNIKDVEGSRF